MGPVGDECTLGALWRAACARIDRLDARLLLEHVGRCTHTELIAHPERQLTAALCAEYRSLVTRRERGEPFAYLVGSASFYDLEFAVSAAVLIPRADTEVLVDQARRCLESLAGVQSPRVVDLGTGSGIVAIVIARLFPAASVSAVDLSAAALAVARANAERHGVAVRWLHGDWYAPLAGECFELIVSNPPYIVAGDRHLAHNGLPFEPPSALTDGVAGGDGLACVRALIAGAPQHLAAGGRLFIEHGYDQAVQVRALLAAAGFDEIASWRDGAAIERVSGGRWPA